jgi:SAM-dependent methyltransferase
VSDRLREQYATTANLETRIALHERFAKNPHWHECQTLPLEDGSFDVVLANHMLYHVPDRPRAFAEIQRVLVPGGAFHAATNDNRSFAELRALVGPRWPYSRHMEAFGLETGPPQLEPFFADVRVERFDGGLVVTEVEPLLAYIRSSLVFDGGDLDGVRAVAEAAIARDGAFPITTDPGVISCRREP